MGVMYVFNHVIDIENEHTVTNSVMDILGTRKLIEKRLIRWVNLVNDTNGPSPYPR